MSADTAPAAMPGEEDVAHYRSMVDRVNRMRDDGTLPGEPKPVPTGLDNPFNACCHREECRKLEARTLAAEAALAEIACQDVVEIALDPDWPRRIAAAAIRAQGE